MKIIITHQNHKVSELNIDRPVENVQVISEEETSVTLAPQALIILLRLLLKDTCFQSQFLQNQPYNNLRIILDEPFKNEIDYKSCNMAFFKVWDQVELEDALHWLSTLGGAYSNLGDHSMDFVSFIDFLLYVILIDYVTIKQSLWLISSSCICLIL